jgi:rod shape determining protein RodA
MLFFYVFINISMVCGLLPVVGIPLPFFSYGGSAMIVLMFSQGIIFAIDAAQRTAPKYMENTKMNYITLSMISPSIH